MAENMNQKNPTPPGTETGMKHNVAATLSYVLGWITGIYFFLTSKDKFVRFHAMQSIVTFLALTVLQWIVGRFYFMSSLLGIVALIVWIMLMMKAYRGEKYKLPVIGDLAEKWSQ